MHLATKILLATIATIFVGAVVWNVVDNRRARRHRQRRLEREAREREDVAAQMTGTDATVGERVEAEIVDPAEAEEAARTD